MAVLRHIPQPAGPFPQTFSHKSQMALLEVTKTAMQQLRASATSLRQTAVLLKETDAPAASSQLPGDAEPIDTATNDGNATKGHFCLTLIGQVIQHITE